MDWIDDARLDSDTDGTMILVLTGDFTNGCTEYMDRAGDDLSIKLLISQREAEELYIDLRRHLGRLA